MSWFEDDYDDVALSRTSVRSTSSRVSDPLSIQPKMAVNLRPADMMQDLALAWTNGLRFGDLNHDKGTIEKENIEAIQVNAQSLLFHQKAAKELQAKRYNDALSASAKAIEFASKIIDHGEQLGELFYQRAKIHNAMEKYKKAKEDIIKAIRCFPLNMTAVVLLGEVLEAVGDYDEAFIVCTRAAKLYETTDDIMAELIQHAVKLFSKVRAGIEALSEMELKDSVWEKVIAGLAKEGSWSSVRILLMGTDDLPALVTSFDASKVQLSGLLESCRETSWRDWGQKLALLLLKHGADHQSLCAKAKYPLHVALRIALKTDTFELLKWLFANRANPSVSSIDENGNNLLHLACRSKAGAKSTAIKLLLNHKVDVSTKNKDDKIPMDYLDKDDKDYDTFMKLMGVQSEPASSKDLLPTRSSLIPIQAPAAGPGLLYPTQIIPNFEHVRTWTKTKVQNWLESNNLSQHKKKFKDLDGPLLYEMKMMQNVAPEMFYKVLEESLQLPLVDLLKVSYFLRHIPQSS